MRFRVDLGRKSGVVAVWICPTKGTSLGKLFLLLTAAASGPCLLLSQAISHPLSRGLIEQSLSRAGKREEKAEYKGKYQSRSDRDTLSTVPRHARQQHDASRKEGLIIGCIRRSKHGQRGARLVDPFCPNRTLFLARNRRSSKHRIDWLSMLLPDTWLQLDLLAAGMEDRR